jgi:parvulin-like peptidyl-prolyl isomerase
MSALKPTESAADAVAKITYPTGGTDYVSRKEFEQARDKLYQNPPEKALLDFLTARHLLIHEARAKNVDADPKQVDQMIEQIRTQTCAQVPPEVVKDKSGTQAFDACASFLGFDGAAGLRRYLQEEGMIEKLIDQEAKPSEELHAAHILVKTEAEAKKARERVTTGGEDFAKVAKEISIDPAAKQNGGDLEWFARGRMIPEFDRVAFAMKDGEISQPVQTQFGWHVIKVLGRRKAEQPSQEAMQGAANAYRQAALKQAQQEGRVQYLITPKADPTQGPPVELPTVEIEPDASPTAAPAR